MASVFEGDRFLVSLRGTLFAQQIISTFWFRAESVIGIPTTSALANAFKTLWNTGGNAIDTYLACCPPQYTMDEMWVQDIFPTRVVANKFTITKPGTYAFGTKETNVASVITRRGDFAARRDISSLHVPYPSLDTGSVGGFLSVGLTSPMANLAATTITTVNLAGMASMRPVINNGKLPLSYSPLTQAFVQNTIRVMRRRTVGHGK